MIRTKEIVGGWWQLLRNNDRSPNVDEMYKRGYPKWVIEKFTSVEHPYSAVYEAVDSRINRFLDEVQREDAYRLLDIKYAIVHDGDTTYSHALVIYEQAAPTNKKKERD